MRSLPPLDPTADDIETAGLQLRRWCETLYSAMTERRIFQSLMTRTESGKPRARFDRSLMRDDAASRLTTFLQGISQAKLAAIDDPERLTATIIRILVALRAAAILNPPKDLTLPNFSEVYELIERAVFRP